MSHTQTHPRILVAYAPSSQTRSEAAWGCLRQSHAFLRKEGEGARGGKVVEAEVLRGLVPSHYSKTYSAELCTWIETAPWPFVAKLAFVNRVH